MTLSEKFIDVFCALATPNMEEHIKDATIEPVIIFLVIVIIYPFTPEHLHSGDWRHLNPTTHTLENQLTKSQTDNKYNKIPSQTHTKNYL